MIGVQDRAARIDRFLGRAGWAEARRRPLAGDASTRRFERLSRGTDTAVLMDAGPEGADQTRRFATIAAWLQDRGYSAPRLFALDEEQGLVLAEDLGDGLVARIVTDDPAQQEALYRLAIDFLTDLARHTAPGGIPTLDAAALGDLLQVTETVYPLAAGAGPATGLSQAVTEIARPLDLVPKVLSLRDFHAENLLWLPGRSGIARLGLLDFQDAVAAHPAYDFVSLTRDARRNVPAGLTRDLSERFCRQNRLDSSQFQASCAVIGAQRSLRIIGVFARLATEHGKISYLDLLPRVWSYLRRDLAAPGLARLRDVVESGLPEPTPEVLNRIRSRCQPSPAP